MWNTFNECEGGPINIKLLTTCWASIYIFISSDLTKLKSNSIYYFTYYDIPTASPAMHTLYGCIIYKSQ